MLIPRRPRVDTRQDCYRLSVQGKYVNPLGYN
jgi:hypothetical protein